MQKMRAGSFFRKYTFILLLPLVTMVFCITLAIFLALRYGGAYDVTLNSELENYNNRAVNLRGRVTSRMYDWANTYEFEKIVASLHKSGNAENKGDVTDFIELFALNDVTGVFIIFVLPEVTTSTATGIYIRSEHQNAISAPVLSDNVLQDYEKAGVDISTRVSASFDFSDTQSGTNDYYYKPLNALLKTHDKGEILSNSDYYKYWAQPHSAPDGTTVISYSLPVYHSVYDGSETAVIIGIDISLDRLNRVFALENTSANFSATLATEGNGELDAFFSQGANILDGTVSLYRDKTCISETNFLANGGSVFVESDNMSLYRNFDFYADQDWNLAVSVPSEVLFIASKKILQSLNVTILITTILGLAAAVSITLLMARPLKRLPQEIDKLNNDYQYAIPKTGVYEVDQLIDATQRLAVNVTENGTFIMDIIEMSGANLFAFKVEKDSRRLYLTANAAKISGMPDIQNGKTTALEFYDYVETHKHKDNQGFVSSNQSALLTYCDTDGIVHWLVITASETEKEWVGVVQDVTERYNTQMRMRYEREHSLKTNLFNYEAFSKLAATKIADNDYAVFALFDIDNLKMISNTYGYAVGDQALTGVATRLRTFIGVSESVCGDISDGKFAVLFYGADMRAITQDINALWTSIEEEQFRFSDGKTLSLSGGYAVYPEDAITYGELENCANYALSHCKKKQRGAFMRYNSHAYAKELKAYERNAAFKHLVEEAAVDFMFQPIISLRSGRIYGYEALMRPRIAEFKSPMEILEAAAAMGRLDDVERLTWFGALAYYTENREAFCGKHLFVNSIANIMLSDEDVAELSELDKNVLNKVILELTENERLDLEKTERKKRVISDWGAYTALDDYGAGYATQNTLLVFNPHIIKIDICIVRQIHRNPHKQKLVRNIVDYARSRHIKVIAEGVEQREELECILECGADYVQGYYIAKPSYDIPTELPKVAAEISEIKKALKERAAKASSEQKKSGGERNKRI